MKKEVTAVICVVLAIWFFFMGFELGIYKERKSAQDSTSNIVTVPTVTSTEPTSSQPDTTMPTSAEPTTAEPTTIQPTSENPTESTTKKKDDQTTEPTTKKDNDPSSMSKEEIIAEMKKAFKTVKAEQNMTAKKDEEISVQLTKLSAESLKNMVNSVIQNLVGAEHITYTFVNGTATAVDGDGKAVDGTFTMDGLLPPDGKEWNCNPDGVASAIATKKGDGVVYEVKLKEEDTTFTEPIPPYSSDVFGYLDLTSIDIKIATITDASMHYSGTSVKVTVDGNGRVTEIHYNMPMSGYGAAKAGFLTGEASFEGFDDEVWTFTY